MFQNNWVAAAQGIQVASLHLSILTIATPSTSTLQPIAPLASTPPSIIAYNMSSSTWSDRKASTNSRATDFMSKRELDGILGVHMTNILFDPKSEASRESYEQLPTQLLGYTIVERCKNYVKSVKGALRDFACGDIDGAKQAFDEVEVPWSSESESTASSTSSSSNHTKAPVSRLF